MVGNQGNAAAPNYLFDEVDQINRETILTLESRHGITNETGSWNGRLARDLKPVLFDHIYPWVWPFATKAGKHIDPLHRAVIKKRTIFVAEDPKLHLVWFKDTIYIKPLPDYLLNFSVWRTKLTDPNMYQAAAGFLRSYSFLIQHESDFVAAQKSNLLPKYVSFLRFQRFIRRFRALRDDEVSPRYHYGQLRLNRLNWVTHASKLATFIPHMQAPGGGGGGGQPHHMPDPSWVHPWYYHETQWEFRQHIQHWVAPLVFIFASLSLILSAMQVGLASVDMGEIEGSWSVFVRTSKEFAIATIVAAAAPLVLAALALVIASLAQLAHAVRAEVRRRRPNQVGGGGGGGGGGAITGVV